MPTVLEMILDYELDMLEMISEKWGINPEIIHSKNPHNKIADALNDISAFNELYEILELKEQQALLDLSVKKGRIKWDQFSRKYGGIREMGAILRERERPDRNPVSISEHLFYLGMIGRGFLKVSDSLEEYAFLPVEFLNFLGDRRLDLDVSLLPQTTAKRLKPIKWSEGVIDHATTLLAELRKHGKIPQISFIAPKIPVNFLLPLLKAAEIININGTLNPEEIKIFLMLDRGDAFGFLFTEWINTNQLNEISLIDSIEIDRKIKFDPSKIRGKLIDLSQMLPEKDWVSMGDFIQWAHDQHPDFLRSAGEYESWLVKDAKTGEVLRGFSNWNKIEGALLEYWLRYPAFWFGLVDIAKSPKTSEETLYLRQSKKSDMLLFGKSLEITYTNDQNIQIEENGTIKISRTFPRNIRYQIARFTHLENSKTNYYTYRITSASLSQIKAQDLNPDQLINLLRKYGRKPVPKNIFQALKRWKENNIETEVKEGVILKVNTPAILEILKNSPASSHILEQFNENTVLITLEGIPFIQSILLKKGLFTSINIKS